MSLYGAMNAAVSGLTAQSASFSNISDNVANSQTVGFKRTDTAFIDYLTTSTASQNNPGSVITRPEYRNDVQGTVTQSDGTLALAITGQGFFPVSRVDTTQGGTATFAAQQYYTRAGDFTLNKDGYVVNSAGDYLDGWSVDPSTGVADRLNTAPIKVTQTVYQPVATSAVTLSANLPATPATGTATTSQVTIYDSLGNTHVVNLNWTQNANNDWNVSVTSADDINSSARGTAEVKFGATASGNAVSDGTLGSISNATGSVTAGAFSANSPATLTFTSDFGNGAQTVTLNLGTYGSSSGVTQYSGTTYLLRGISQNGIPAGAYSSVSTTSSGDIVVNYDNGQSRTIARVPIITFANPNALQKQNGEAFTTTVDSGPAFAQDAGTNGAGRLTTGAVEASNVDIASEFTKLIVAQRAYSANAKMVTTADDLLQQTVDMKR